MLSNQMFTAEEIIGGHSDARLFHVAIKQQEYCAKVYPGKFKFTKYQTIQEICQIYRNLDIQSLRLLGYGDLQSSQGYFFLFNYIHGDNFKTLNDRQNDPKIAYQTGLNLGQQLKRLKVYSLPTHSIPHENLATIGKTIEEYYQKLLSDPATRTIIETYLDFTCLHQMQQEFANYIKILSKQPSCLIHGDIKRSNLMVDRNNQVYLIDIGSMKYSYDILNFRYQMTWLLSPNNPLEYEFVQGVLDGLYGQKYPQDFSQQVRFATFLNFVEHAYKISQNLNKLKEYCKYMQNVFPRMDILGQSTHSAIRDISSSRIFL